MPKAKIIQEECNGSHKTGQLSGISVDSVTRVLGFKPDGGDGGEKVKYNWDFKYRGHNCSVWDWKGSYRQKEFSTFGPSEILRELFGDNFETYRF